MPNNVRNMRYPLGGVLWGVLIWPPPPPAGSKRARPWGLLSAFEVLKAQQRALPRRAESTITISDLAALAGFCARRSLCFVMLSVVVIYENERARARATKREQPPPPHALLLLRQWLYYTKAAPPLPARGLC